MESIAAVGGRLVAVGTDRTRDDGDAAVWVSDDGLNWVRVPHDEAELGGPGHQEMHGVTAGGPGLVAVGHTTGSDGDLDAAAWWSVDGITWSRVPHDDALFGGSGRQDMWSVAAAGSNLVAVGDQPRPGATAVWTSPDGMTWSRVPDDEGTFSNTVIDTLTDDGSQVIATGLTWSSDPVGNLAAMWTSPDGMTWTRVGDDDPVGSLGAEIFGVAAAGSRMVAVGSDASPAGPAVWVVDHP